MSANGQGVRQDIQEAGDIENPNPLGVRDVDGETSRPKLITSLKTLSLQPPKVEEKIVRKSAPTKETVCMDMTLPFIRNKLVDHTVPLPSTYVPSSLMLYYTLHCMDSLMVQNHHFMQNNAHYHPLLMRIYYGTTMYIQILRCMNHLKLLSRNDAEFLKNFLEAYPPECISIAGPLGTLFRSLTCSTSRFVYQGKICPRIHNTTDMTTITKPKPKTATQPEVLGTTTYPNEHHLLPNMYLLHGFVNSLTSDRLKAVANTTEYPRVWHPFMAIANPAANNERTVPQFNGVDATDISAWTNDERWGLANPAILYPNEATKEQNERFTLHGDQLLIPRISVTEGSLDIESFLNLQDLRWFGEVLALATSHSKYFKSPITLDKCPVEGPGTSQVLIKYNPPRTPVTSPTAPGDARSQFPLIYRAASCNPELTDTEQLMAFTAQLNVTMYPSHPKYGVINNTLNLREGPFWNIRPICMQTDLDQGFYQVKDVINDHFYQDKPKY